MGLFKRLSATINASMEAVVDKVENHDAVIEAALLDCRKAAAQTRVRLVRLRKDGEQLCKQLTKAEDDIHLWQNRALTCADENHQRALQCVKRKKIAESQSVNLAERLEQHRNLEQQVQSRLMDIEQKISEISRQRNAMRSRQSVAEASELINRLDGSVNPSIDETFERWESRLLSTELEDESTDSLEADFIHKEEMQDLGLELEILIAENRETQNG